MRQLSKKVRYMNLLAVVLLVLSIDLMVSPHLTKASCSGNANCYGAQLWPGATLGGKTLLDVVQVGSYIDQSENYSSAEVRNEFWFKDTTNQDGYCSQNNGFCYVGAGYRASATVLPFPYSNSQTKEFFWEDNRPGLGYIFHTLGNFVVYNPPARLGITIRSDYTNLGQVDIAFTNYAIANTNCSSDPTVQQCSTSNSMQIYVNGNYLIVGEEVTQSTNSQGLYPEMLAPPAAFNENSWIDNNRNSPYQNNYGAGIVAASPPYAFFLAPPTTSNHGGTFSVQCGQSNNNYGCYF